MCMQWKQISTSSENVTLVDVYYRLLWCHRGFHFEPPLETLDALVSRGGGRTSRGGGHRGSGCGRFGGHSSWCDGALYICQHCDEEGHIKIYCTNTVSRSPLSANIVTQRGYFTTTHI